MLSCVAVRKIAGQKKQPTPLDINPTKPATTNR
jgi:hypothetical protein